MRTLVVVAYCGMRAASIHHAQATSRIRAAKRPSFDARKSSASSARRVRANAIPWFMSYECIVRACGARTPACSAHTRVNATLVTPAQALVPSVGHTMVFLFSGRLPQQLLHIQVANQPVQ